MDHGTNDRRSVLMMVSSMLIFGTISIALCLILVLGHRKEIEKIYLADYNDD